MKIMNFRTTAIIVSIFLHALLFANFPSESFQGEKKVAKREIVTRIGFVNLGEGNEEKPVPEEIIVEKEPPPKPPKEKLVEKKIIPKKTKKAVKKVKVEQEKPVIEEKREVSVASASQAVEVGTVDFEEEEERYLRELVAMIEKEKFYPKTARRRGVEGSVKVSFLIHHNGEMEELKVSGKKVLCKAAKEAIQRALPLPPPIDIKNCPIKVEYEMVYALK